jgi:hypothetical protein
MTKAWVVVGGSFEISRNMAEFSYDLLSMGRDIAEVPPPVPSTGNIVMHAGQEPIGGEGGGLITPTQDVIFLSPQVEGDDKIVGTYHWDAPEDVAAYQVGQARTVYVYDDILYVSNYALTWEDEDQMFVTLQTYDLDPLDPDTPVDFLFTQPITFPHQGVSGATNNQQWGPMYWQDEIYWFVADDLNDEIALYRNSLDTPTAAWEKVYTHSVSYAGFYRATDVVPYGASGRVIPCIGHVTLRSDDAGDTWTREYLGLTFQPLQRGTVLQGVPNVLSLDSRDDGEGWSIKTSMDGDAWTTWFPAVIGSPYIALVWFNSKLFEGFGKIMVTMEQSDNIEGNPADLCFYGNVLTMNGLNTDVFPLYGDLTNEQRIALEPRIQWAFAHGGGDAWFVVFNTVEDDEGFCVVLEYDPGMGTLRGTYDVSAEWHLMRLVNGIAGY